MLLDPGKVQCLLPDLVSVVECVTKGVKCECYLHRFQIFFSTGQDSESIIILTPRRGMQRSLSSASRISGCTTRSNVKDVRFYLCLLLTPSHHALTSPIGFEKYIIRQFQRTTR